MPTPVTERLPFARYARLWRARIEPYASLPEVWDGGSDRPLRGADKARAWRGMIACVAREHPSGALLISPRRSVVLVLNVMPQQGQRR